MRLFATAAAQLRRDIHAAARRGPMPGRRPRRARGAPALPTQTPPPMAVNQSARKVARRGQTGGPSDGPLPRRAKLPVARLGRPRPPDHPRDQRHPLQPTRPPTPHANQVPGRRPGHGRGGDSRMGMDHSGRSGWLQPSGAQPAAACAAIICSSSGIGWSAGGSVRLRAGSLVALTRSSKPPGVSMKSIREPASPTL